MNNFYTPVFPSISLPVEARDSGIVNSGSGIRRGDLKRGKAGTANGQGFPKNKSQK